MFLSSSTVMKFLVYSLMTAVTIFPAISSGTTLEKMAAQMIMVGFHGLELDDENPIVEDIVEYGIGGVMLEDYDAKGGAFERNIQSPDQLKELTDSLKSLPGGNSLFIAVRHEGGDNTVLKERYGFNRSVSQRHLGKNDNTSLTMDYSLDSAQYLSELGINLNLTPLVGLDVNDKDSEIHSRDRYFSRNPEVVIDHSWEVINAHRIFKVLTAVKYFPGGGSAGNDFHQGFIDVTRSWRERELLPYQELIEEPGCDMVMAGHIFNRRLDPDWPASLSEKTINKILRQRLGYDGVVISSDMQVPAIRDNYSLETVLERAVLAGADIILFGNNMVYEPDIARRSIQAIMKLIDQGRISKKRINESYNRIVNLKSRLKPLVESDCSFCLE